MDAREFMRREARRCRAMAGASLYAKARWIDAAQRYDDAAGMAVIAAMVEGQAAEADRIGKNDE